MSLGITEWLVSQASFPDFYLDGVPVGEVAVDADYADVLGAGCGSDGYEEVALPGDELGFWNYFFRV
jgi:hypothetical protein